MNYLLSQVNHERRPLTARKKTQFSLTRITRLLTDLGNPHKSLRTVHIAGSKGKGSTAAMLSYMLQANGLKVGVYTSPHLLDIRERIMIGTEKISEAEFTRLVAKIAAIVAEYKTGCPTFFDMLTAMAFKYFADREVDVAIIETGLGGRLDSTNVIEPEVCGLTSISFDHVPQLGTTLSDIAQEKAGVFKKGVTVISAEQTGEVKQILKKAADQARSPLMFVGDEIGFTYRFESSKTGGPQARIGLTTPNCRYDHLAVPLVGQHQAINCGVAIGLLDELKNKGFEIDDEASVAGLSKVSLPGRMQTLCTSPRVVADGAHNASSISALMRAIGQNVPYDSMVVIFGCCADKDINGMLQHVLLGADKVIFTDFGSPRAADPADLARAFAEITSGRMAQSVPTLAKAVENAEKAITRDDLICITGSFYLVAEAIRFFEDHPHRV
ncbi:MAG: bifunctional folylpolyglutamate synthase/dihydrofolate synthase [Planctomycetota bacterium]|nr:bifunctional folylpolyglutamate synthase/dihydrofolate synthase [Planctomycetota bacterium]